MGSLEISVSNQQPTTTKFEKKMNSIIAAATIGLVSAGGSQMQADLTGLISNSSMRQFTGAMADAVNQLDEYGCWCYFYDNVGRGKGQPIDEVDGFCKTLNEGYECAIRDSEEEGISCTPWEVAYVSGTGSGSDLFTSCQNLTLITVPLVLVLLKEISLNKCLLFLFLEILSIMLVFHMLKVSMLVLMLVAQ